MKTLLIASILLFLTPSFAQEEMNWKGLEKGRIELAYPLLTIRGDKGFLGCGYFNVDVCDKTKEACAIVTGVSNHNEMLTATIKQASSMAKELGIQEGMTGKEAIELLR